MTEELNMDYLKTSIKDALYIIAVIPLALAAFPIPLLFPVLLIWQAIEQPEETMLAVIYFIWLIVSLIYIYCYDRKRESAKTDRTRNDT